MAREMKNSGIEWIGQIPADWEITKHKYVMYKVKDICDKYNIPPTATRTIHIINPIVIHLELLVGLYR